MPVHNGARFLRPAIDSVLQQTHRDFELFVIDDDSSDGSVAIARQYADARIRTFAGHGRHGLAATLNIGLDAASGQYVARLDQDDVAHPDRLEKQVAFLEARPEVALVGSLARLIDDHDRQVGVVRRPVTAVGIRWYSLLENPLIHSTAMFRLDVARRLGGYDASLAYAEDYELWGRMLQAHAVENLAECLVDYRRWSSSMMTSVETDAAGPRQRLLHQIMASLIERRIIAELGGPACSPAQAQLLATFTLGVRRERWREFMSLLDGLRAGFEAKWRAAATREADYWRTVADQVDAIAFRMVPASRLSAAGVYAHACAAAPRAAAYLPWLKVAALLALGKRGRQRAGEVISGR